MTGKTNPADVLSRLPLTNQPHRERSIADEYIHYVTTRAVPKAFTLEQLLSATKADPLLEQVKKSLRSGQWSHNPKLQQFQKIKEELSASQGLLLCGPRIVPPESLKADILQSAHGGHQGIVRTKQMVREKIWWPGIDREIESMVKACIPCQSMAPKSAPEPLRPTVMPDKPWQDIHVDLCGPFPTGESLLVCEDACTRWPEVTILRSTTTRVLINHLKRIFAMHGLPVKIVTDNGPQFISKEFETFMKDHGITHRKVTPYWPQANAEVERFNRTIAKAIRAAHVEGKDWRQEIYVFLLNYRATPNASTGISPAMLHLGRELRTKVPQVQATSTSNDLEDSLNQAQSNDLKAKEKMVKYADSKKKAKPSTVSIGDKVLLQQDKQNKLSTRYGCRPYIVVERCGPSVVLQRGDGARIMRNVSFIHKLPDVVEVDDD